jgi:hypothetical protein
MSVISKQTKQTKQTKQKTLFNKLWLIKWEINDKKIKQFWWFLDDCLWIIKNVRQTQLSTWTFFYRNGTHHCVSRPKYWKVNAFKSPSLK